MQSQPNLDSFESIYREGCKILQEHPENLLTYQELDVLYKFIEEHPDKDKFKAALSPDRVCIALPYALFKDKRLPPDGESQDGEPLIFACPGLDGYVSILLDQMTLTAGTEAYVNFGAVEVFNKWKLMRLARLFGLGWQGFANSYLAPLRDRQKYIEGFKAAQIPK